MNRYRLHKQLARNSVLSATTGNLESIGLTATADERAGLATATDSRGRLSTAADFSYGLTATTNGFVSLTAATSDNVSHSIHLQIELLLIHPLSCRLQQPFRPVVLGYYPTPVHGSWQLT